VPISQCADARQTGVPPEVLYQPRRRGGLLCRSRGHNCGHTRLGLPGDRGQLRRAAGSRRWRLRLWFRDRHWVRSSGKGWLRIRARSNLDRQSDVAA